MSLTFSPQLLRSVRLASRTTNHIRAAMAAGTLPWSRPARLGYACGLPIDENGLSVPGVTRWLLELAAITRGSTTSRWTSQSVLGGDGGVEVVVGVEVPGQAWKDYHTEVFYQIHDSDQGPKAPDYGAARRLVDASGAWVKPGCSPIYHRTESGVDFIVMPTEAEYDRLDDYWWVMFHELTHWATFGFQRLNWSGEAELGEMIAEMGAAILVDHCGIVAVKNEPGPHHQKWLDGMTRNSGYFYEAADVADRAVGHILRC